MATIRELQETAREGLDAVSSVKGDLEDIFENNDKIAEVIMNDGNMKSDVFKIYELLDNAMESIMILTAHCVAEKQVSSEK